MSNLLLMVEDEILKWGGERKEEGNEKEEEAKEEKSSCHSRVILINQ